MHLRVTKSPSEALALTNCAFVHPSDLPQSAQYISLNGRFRFNVRGDSSVEPGHVGLSKVQRGWAQLALEDEVAIEIIDPTTCGNVCADTLTVQIDFMRKGSDQSAVFDSGKMAEMFHKHFDLHVFTLSQVQCLNKPCYLMSLRNSWFISTIII